METHGIPFYAERKAALIEEINAAFDGVSRAGGVSMSEANVIDDYGSGAECAVARARDTDTRWQDVTDEQLAGFWPLSFFDSIGFHYYMPAYLIYYLRRSGADEDEIEDENSNQDGNNFGSLDYSLSGGNDKAGLGEFYLSKFELFTPAQGRAVAHFLELEAEVADAWEREFAQMEADSEVDEKFEEWKTNNARREAEKLARMSPEALKELEARDLAHEAYRAGRDWPDNESRYALERYWGRFL